MAIWQNNMMRPSKVKVSGYNSDLCTPDKLIASESFTTSDIYIQDYVPTTVNELKDVRCLQIKVNFKMK